MAQKLISWLFACTILSACAGSSTSTNSQCTNPKMEENVFVTRMLRIVEKGSEYYVMRPNERMLFLSYLNIEPPRTNFSYKTIGVLKNKRYSNVLIFMIEDHCVWETLYLSSERLEKIFLLGALEL